MIAGLRALEDLSWAEAFAASFTLVFSLLLPLLLLRDAGGAAAGAPRRARTLVVLGSGGHTTEMLSMLAALPAAIASGSVFIIAATDTMSEAKLLQCYPGAAVRRTPRAREVRQSWLTR
jgi:beta-1,4-N-acetylglucosaminyltransferase